MAYQNVGTPRFYIDLFQYIIDSGYEIEIGGANKNIIGLDPVRTSILDYGGVDITWGQNIIDLEIPRVMNPDKAYMAMLNYDNIWGYDENLWYIARAHSAGRWLDTESVLNYNYNSTSYDSSLVGSSIFTGDVNMWVSTEDAENIYNGIRIYDWIGGSVGSVSFGSYFDMPVSPNLDLTMSIEFEGSKNTKTLNGSNITQTNYSGSPWWYDSHGDKKEPWAVGNTNPEIDYTTGNAVDSNYKYNMNKRNGRRVWNLSFSYMTDSDLFASNYMNNTYTNIDSLDNYNPSDIAPESYGTDLIDNGTFTGNADGWTSPGSGTGSYDDNNFKYEGGTVILRQSGIDPPLKAGKSYKIIFEVEEYTSGILTFQIGNKLVGYTELEGGNRWYEFDALCDTDTDSVRLISLDGFTEFIGSIDNVSVKEIIPQNFYYTIANDPSFHTQVLGRISMGQKFIFSPNNQDNNPSNFAICTLDGDSFNIKRVAHNVYDMEMTIKEVW